MALIDPADSRAVHFVGIAGAGMNGLAELLVRRGVKVTGCDQNLAGCDNLAALGVEMMQGHAASHVDNVRAVVVTSAVPRSHPELLRAIELGVPVIRRAEALAEAVSGRRVVAIAGTHGKTTTTVMTTLALAAAGGEYDPTGVVGGRVRAWGSNLRIGSGDVAVVEADEYDRSFLALTPEIAVVTNVEADHLDIYRDFEDIRETFSIFASPARVLVACADDDGALAVDVPPQGTRVTYGILETGKGGSVPDYSATELNFSGSGVRFRVTHGTRGVLGEVALRVPGLHNVRNALAALAAGLELGAPFETLARGLGEFGGVERRFEFIGESRGITIIDDYAHHPTEIAATLEAARSVYPGRRIICAFQPHLYSRTRDFAGQFGRALAAADEVILTEVYPAREAPIPGVDAGLIAEAINLAGGVLRWRGAREYLVASLLEAGRNGDVVITVGAGDITSASRDYLDALMREP